MRPQLKFLPEFREPILAGRKTRTRRRFNPQPKPTGVVGGNYWAGEYYVDRYSLTDHLFHNVYGVEGCPLCEVGEQFDAVDGETGEIFATLELTNVVIEWLHDGGDQANWEKCYGPGSYDVNLVVWVYEFKIAATPTEKPDHE